MVKRPLVLLSSAALLLLVACGNSGASTAPSISTPTLAATVAPASHAATPAATTAATTTPASTAPESVTPATTAPESPGASGSPAASSSPAAAVCNATAGTPNAGASFNPTSITGTADLGHWDSSPAENDALNCALKGFAATYPNVTVTNEDVAGDYAAQMTTRFGAHNPPDVFYVNADVASDWIAQGFLLPLDDYIANSGFDMSHFFPGYQSTFKGSDGKTYGIAKDGNTIAMEYNKDLVTTPPTTLADLMTVAQGLKGQSGLTAPICLSEGLDRGLAFLYAQGGSLLTSDNSAEAIDTDASKAAIQWYMDLFKSGLGAPPPANSWCGQELGLGHVAIVFEGGWMTGAMTAYPSINWAYAEMPQGSIGKPMTISYTAAYGIGADSKNPDQGWTALQYLTGTDGMALWTSGGIAVPSRDDVPVPQGYDVITKGATYAMPGSGFMPHYTDVQKAFQDAFTQEVQNGTFDAGPVVSATSAAITTALTSQ
jgi:multiple sugar transport system substrate-binding protein